MPQGPETRYCMVGEHSRLGKSLGVNIFDTHGSVSPDAALLRISRIRRGVDRS